jgi:predicted GNAT family acetyltransferase
MMQVAFTDTELLITEEGKLLGKIEFSLSNNTMTILHTYAYESGRGIGTILMQNAVSWAKERHYTIVPVCSFAQKYLKRKNKSNVSEINE